MNKIRKGDQVIVITGRDKGKRGVITQRVDDEHVIELFKRGLDHVLHG